MPHSRIAFALDYPSLAEARAGAARLEGGGGFFKGGLELFAQEGPAAFGAGVRGFVCSPAEVRALRSEFGPDVTLVTPGVRPAGTAVHDQKRVATPADAIADGADIVVVGRPIRDAPDPAAAARAVAKDIPPS